MKPSESSDIRYFRADGVCVVLDVTPPDLPRILHWGADLGELTQAELRELARISRRQPVANEPDDAPILTVLPENSLGWTGTPGLEGHRDGTCFATRFRVAHTNDTASGVVVHAEDADAGLALDLTVELLDCGLGRMRATLHNTAPGVYTVDGLRLAWPVPLTATDILDFTGHHARERSPQRHEFTQGTYERSGRHGRTGADATLLLLAGESGFRFRQGEVWGVHTAWSGNHTTLAERTAAAESVLAGGELLLPGEIRLDTAQSYTSPWVYASYGRGIDAVSSRFHRFLRAQPHAPRQPRPVTGNCWEAVYFNHDLTRLTTLADAFAGIGVERFVLDDGWFRGRRHDKAGLGDWYVDEAVWPHGLHPLVDHVRALGMEFGLWVEPEMVNMDSDLARAHPEWILAPAGRMPPEQRHQQVLNLGNRDAWAYVRDRLDALIGEYRIDYLKWDHNRDLIDPGDQAGGVAGVHAQTVAAYALMDHLKATHPGLEIESCSSGGARCDLEVLQHTDRIWASDCTDAHERQMIQRYTGLLVPPELMGAHISADPNHQSGRRLSLAMRAATAMFGDLGIEWDITGIPAQDRADLADWVAAYKQWRGLLHSGDVVRLDHPHQALWAHGVVAADRETALFCAVMMESSAYAPPGLLRLDGLDAARVYRVEPLESSRRAIDPHCPTAPPWWPDGLVAPGNVLCAHGFQVPDLPPDTPLVLAVTALDQQGSL